MLKTDLQLQLADQLVPSIHSFKADVLFGKRFKVRSSVRKTFRRKNRTSVLIWHLPRVLEASVILEETFLEVDFRKKKYFAAADFLFLTLFRFSKTMESSVDERSEYLKCHSHSRRRKVFERNASRREKVRKILSLEKCGFRCVPILASYAKY